MCIIGKGNKVEIFCAGGEAMESTLFSTYDGRDGRDGYDVVVMVEIKKEK